MFSTQPNRRTWYAAAGAALGVALMTGLIHLVPGADRIPNVSMLYLLVVLGTAIRFGSGPAILASVLSFLAFDWFFVEPRYTFTVRDPAEWIALLMFLLSAIVTGHLTATAQRRAEDARQRERETRALADASWAVASQLSRDQALEEVLRRVVEVVPAGAAAILAPDSEGHMAVIARAPAGHAGLIDVTALREAVRFVLSEGKAVAWGEGRRHWDKALGDDLPAGVALLPLTSEHHVLGTLYLQLPPQLDLAPTERRVVESLANHAAVVLERERFVRSEARVQALDEADRLKTALLSMVSHDFRSPLASIKASASALQQAGVDEATREELLEGIDTETDRLNRMVGNILSLSRLEADAWRPQRELASVSELIGAALGSFDAAGNARIDVRCSTALSEVSLDLVQMVQVLRNLVENALKYSPAESTVEISAEMKGEQLVIEVADRGRGFKPEDSLRLFEPFYRAADLHESAMPGVGIGLAVCRGLVEAHGGTLTARNREGGGSVFRIAMPAVRE